MSTNGAKTERVSGYVIGEREDDDQPYLMLFSPFDALNFPVAWCYIENWKLLPFSVNEKETKHWVGGQLKKDTALKKGYMTPIEPQITVTLDDKRRVQGILTEGQILVNKATQSGMSVYEPMGQDEEELFADILNDEGRKYLMCVEKVNEMMPDVTNEDIRSRVATSMYINVTRTVKQYQQSANTLVAKSETSPRQRLLEQVHQASVMTTGDVAAIIRHALTSHRAFDSGQDVADIMGELGLSSDQIGTDPDRRTAIVRNILAYADSANGESRDPERWGMLLGSLRKEGLIND